MENGDAVDFALDIYTVPGGNVVNFELGNESLANFLMGFELRKKLGKPGAPDPLGVNGIYQMRMTKTGKRPIKMKFYTPTNPRTVAQQANRNKFADAMTAWQALTAGDKAQYNKRAKKKGMFGRNLFIREYFSNN